MIFSSCSKHEFDNPRNTSSVNQSEWLVPIEEILYLGTSHDKIIAVDHPQFVSVNEAHHYDEDRMLIAFYNGSIRVYPIRIMEEHEIVNDKVGDHYFSITYCPITGSGLNWNREINGQVTTFGVSGMLYNENLIPYDRNSESY